MNYFDHKTSFGVGAYAAYADAKGRSTRQRADAWNAARARMLATIEEYDMGAVTLYMPKYEIRARLAEARYLKGE